MSAAHKKLFDRTMGMIEDLFGDTSVSRSQTKEDLQQIIDDCQIKLMAMSEDSDDEDEE